ncbi:MAG TPA: ABC transporter ATP-binding protein, partial [Candidatus Coprovivens excrementavium]|nr:ABC transporter ATP-binding protein [Candidatus Coprovivens excrementavium]
HMLTKRQKINFIIIIIIMIISALLTQLLPLSIGRLTDDVLNQNELSFISVLPFLGFILVITVTNEIIKVIRRLLVEDTSTRFEKSARTKAISSLLHAPLNYFKENMTGNIHGKLNRSLEGTTKLLKLIFMDFAPAIFNGLAAIVVIFSKLPVTLALLMLLVIPIGIIIVFRQITTQRGIRVELMNEKSNMDGTIVELINGIEVIRIVNNAENETNRFDNTSEYLRRKEMKHHKAMALYDCLKFINEAVFTVLIIGVSAYLAGEGIISVGTVLTAYLSFTQLTTPLRELHRIFDELSESTVLAEEYFKIIELPKDFSYEIVEQDSKPKKSLPIISIKNMDFKYQNASKYTIKDLNLNIQKGEFIGIAGPSGCGKSSLIKVISKLEKGEGNIEIDGLDITKLTRKDIATKIALVPQSPFLISATIKENICYGINREVTDAEIKEACQKAFIDDFIENLPDKYETKISEGGGNLSGGQRQRIAIARIFLRKPSILILDEATSALDNTTEKHIQKAIETFQKENNITILSIAHRLTTLKNCDNILVFDKGKIVEQGKYQDLINKPGIFQDMYNGVLK